MIRIAIIEDELAHLLQVIADVCSFDPEGIRTSILPVLVKPASRATVQAEMAQVRERLELSLVAGGKKLNFPAIDQSLGLIDLAQPAERDRLLSHLKTQEIDVILSDCSMGPELAGLELLDAASSDQWATQAKWQCWLMTQYPDLQQMFHVTQQFLNFDPYSRSLDKSLMLKNGTGECALELRKILEIALQSKKEREEIEADYWFRSPTLHEQFERSARNSGPVVIVGPEGTRKESAGRSIHAHSNRRDGPFISFDCGKHSKETIERKLFGHNHQEGLVERARGGTLFLDGIDELRSETQSLLLRALQTMTARRIGQAGREQRGLDFRLIAGSRRGLDKAGLRRDLCDFLRDGKIEIPPLHTRRDDIPLLIKFLQKEKPASGLGCVALTPSATKIFKQWPWPRNDQELLETIERARPQAIDGVIDSQCPVVQEIHRNSQLVEHQSSEQIWAEILLLNARYCMSLSAWPDLIGARKTLELAQLAERHFGDTCPPKGMVAKYFGGMRYTRFKATLNYLKFQLWIEERKKRYPHTRAHTRKMWEQIFGWPVIVFVVGIGFAIATAALGISEFRIARSCFVISIALLAAKFVHWIVRQKSHFLTKAAVACFVFGFVGLSSLASLHWVNSRQETSRTGPAPVKEGVEETVINEAIELAKKINQISQQWEQQAQLVRERYPANEKGPNADSWATDPEIYALSLDTIGAYEKHYKAKVMETRNKLLQKLTPAASGDVKAEVFQDDPNMPPHVRASRYKMVAAELERLALELKRRFTSARSEGL